MNGAGIVLCEHLKDIPAVKQSDETETNYSNAACHFKKKYDVIVSVGNAIYKLLADAFTR